MTILWEVEKHLVRVARSQWIRAKPRNRQFTARAAKANVFATLRPHKGVILSVALRKSIAQRAACRAESKDPGVTYWQMSFEAFQP
jgi:hypothetical protein